MSTTIQDDLNTFATIKKFPAPPENETEDISGIASGSSPFPELPDAGEDQSHIPTFEERAQAEDLAAQNTDMMDKEWVFQSLAERIYALIKEEIQLEQERAAGSSSF